MRGQSLWLAPSPSQSQVEEGARQGSCRIVALANHESSWKPTHTASRLCHCVVLVLVLDAGPCACDLLFSQLGHWSFPSFELLNLLQAFLSSSTESKSVAATDLCSQLCLSLPPRTYPAQNPKFPLPLPPVNKKRATCQLPNPPPVNHQLHRSLNWTLKPIRSCRGLDGNSHPQLGGYPPATATSSAVTGLPTNHVPFTRSRSPRE
jgi:hypothetical protein